MAVIRNKHTARRSRSAVIKMKFEHSSSRLPTIYHTEESKTKRGLKYITTWFQQWYSIHFVLLAICIFSYLYISPSNRNQDVYSWSLRNNESFIRIRNLKSIQSGWCLSSAMFLNDTNSYAVMDRSVNILYSTCFLLSVIGILLYILSVKLQRYYKESFFWFGMLIFLIFIGSSICNQLISSFTCRPVEILYDNRYVSLIVIQVFTFIISLYFAYGMGRTFGSYFGHPKPSELATECPRTNSNGYDPSLSLIHNIP